MTDDYLENEMVIKEIDVKGIMTKSNLPVAVFSVNPYVGCSHACKYCYARGVLSEDGIYNMLERNKEIMKILDGFDS